MSSLPNCPQCGSDLTYEDGTFLVCPMCAHEWKETEQKSSLEPEVVRDSNGVELVDGDNVTIIRDIKLKGSNRIKQGMRATKLRILPEPIDGHDIECTMDGFGRIYLKSELVKKN